MMDDSLAQRARACIVAGALGDAWGQLAGAGQPSLFPSSPRLSGGTWLTLATCEATARAGGRVRPSQVAAVFREWSDRARVRADGASVIRDSMPTAQGPMRAPDEESLGPVLCATPLAFVLDPAREDDRAALFGVIRIISDNDEARAAALAGVLAIRCCLQLDRVPMDLLTRIAGALPDSQVRARLFEADRRRGTAADASDDEAGAGVLADAVARSLVVATKYSDGDLLAAFGEAAQFGKDGQGIAALTGQILGAAGADVPGEFLERLPDRAEVEAVLERFVQTVAALPAW
jgi:ADP-ribosylglycohydrolase